MSTGQSSIYSQAFNFGSFLESGVDPRTGLYTFSVDLYETPSHSRDLPSFKLSLFYNPLNTVDSGLGTGWAFHLPFYDPDTKTLVLSTGESFKATEINDRFIVVDQKLQSFQATKLGSEYHVVYKTGQTEVLSNGNGLYNRSVPITVYASNGRAIALTWTPSGSEPRLSKIQDGAEVLVEVQYGDGQVRVVRQPGTPDENVFTLVQKNGQLAQVQSPGENMSPWEFSYKKVDSRWLLLTQLTTPLGSVESVYYRPDGHRLPNGAPYETIPYVTSHELQPDHQQPAIRTSYTYSAKNFLGYDGGRDWTPDGDNLYQVPAGYQYTSTARVEDGATTVNDYDNFHLLVRTERQQEVQKTTRATAYHAIPYIEFSGQPPQCQLPSVVEIAYSNTQSRSERRETTRTSFDEWGNLTQEIQPNQVIVKRTYYPPEGERPDCPADPHGFQRYLKEETVVPAGTEQGATVRTERYTYHELPTARGALVDIYVVAKQQVTLEGDRVLSTVDLTDVDAPTPKDHGRF
ncbi:RHS Repeat protein [Aspergillus nomiae NRRL 13137]|uniref:RHS Repeat protein n=1 Tax=Aspergillus nomiae NRRL (strain ATCC 15546 / NRRL 13137 / CBS 260.88 / M93) TaxID=1509407 RepID=A0A0L1J4T6_ASPN3|nr:RHS Repeat protein [Aspergillus nomiae NRRL 13137]KNG86752.1 RHS Repeat protein [Aspergillus nomiae NRRL 13137]